MFGPQWRFGIHGDRPGAQNVTVVQHDQILNFEYTFLRNGEYLVPVSFTCAGRNLLENMIFALKNANRDCLSKLWPKSLTGSRNSALFRSLHPSHDLESIFQRHFSHQRPKIHFLRCFISLWEHALAPGPWTRCFEKPEYPRDRFWTRSSKRKKFVFASVLRKLLKKLDLGSFGGGYIAKTWKWPSAWKYMIIQEARCRPQRVTKEVPPKTKKT